MCICWGLWCCVVCSCCFCCMTTPLPSSTEVPLPPSTDGMLNMCLGWGLWCCAVCPCCLCWMATPLPSPREVPLSPSTDGMLDMCLGWGLWCCAVCSCCLCWMATPLPSPTGVQLLLFPFIGSFWALWQPVFLFPSSSFGAGKNYFSTFSLQWLDWGESNSWKNLETLPLYVKMNQFKSLRMLFKNEF